MWLVWGGIHVAGLVSMCVGVSVWLGWGGICVAGLGVVSVWQALFRFVLEFRCGWVGVVSVWLGWGGIRVAGLVSICVGVSVWLGWGGIRVAGLVSMCVGVLVWLVGLVSVSQAEACHTDTTPTQPHRNSNTHRNKNTQPMW